MERNELVQILEHDGVPVCEASITALDAFVTARENCDDELTQYYLESRMLDCFNALLVKGV